MKTLLIKSFKLSLAFSLVVIALLVSSEGVHAQTTYTVSNTNDTGMGSLRDAMNTANANPGADNIVFDASLAGMTITLSSALDLNSDLSIDGSAAKGIIISGGWDEVTSSMVGDRVFITSLGDPGGNRTVLLKNLILTNGNAGPQSGGADPGSPLSNGGNMYIEYTDLTIENCVFTKGHANDGGAIEAEESNVTIINSTFHDNTVRDDGGAFDIGDNASLNLSNSTVTNNRCGEGVGFGNQTGGSMRIDGSAIISYTTLAFNQASSDGAIDFNGSSLSISNSIILDNYELGTTTIANCSGAITDGGNNWTNDTSPCLASMNQDNNSNIQLSNSLAANGTSATICTPTLSIPCASSIVNAISGGQCSGMDQRGLARGVGGGSSCEPGAYELTDCDSDGDGVADDVDVCAGFDDTADNDMDMVPDACDLDDDNDGIKDTDECDLSVIPSATAENDALSWAQSDYSIYTISNNTNKEGPTESGWASEATFGGATIMTDGTFPNATGGNFDPIGAGGVSVPFDNGTVDITTNSGNNAFYNDGVGGGGRRELVSGTTDNSLAVNESDEVIDANMGNPVEITLTINFTNPVSAFGFDMLDIFDTQPAGSSNEEFRILVDGQKVWETSGLTGGSDVTGPFTILDGAGISQGILQLGDNKETFTGIVDNNGTFSQVTIEHVISVVTNDADKETWAIDEFTWVEGARCDFDGDGIANHLDTDTDGDGCPDALEGSNTTLTLVDLNADGSVNSTVDAMGIPTGDANCQSIGTSQDNSLTSPNCDDDGDGVLNGVDVCEGSDDTADKDMDMVPDACDLDDDNDGILDDDECPYEPVDVYIHFPTDPSYSPEAVVLVIGETTITRFINQRDGYTSDITVGGFGYSLLESNVMPNSQGKIVVKHIRGGDGNPTVFDAILFVQGADQTVIDNLDPSYSELGVGFTTVTSSDAVGGNVRLNRSGNDPNFEAIFTHIVTRPICDPDGDMVSNECDVDSDGDGCNDAEEAGLTAATTINPDGTVAGPYGANGFADSAESPTESGMANYTIATNGTTNDFQNDMVSTGCADIRVEKAITATAAAATPGNALLTYEIEIFNGGGQLSNTSLVDDLAAQYGSGFVGITTAPTISVPATDGATTLVIASSFDGDGTTAEFFQASGNFAADDSLTITFVAEVDLDQLPADPTNTATASGTTPGGQMISDDSDDRTDLDGNNMNDNPNGPNPEDDPTPVPPIADIRNTKALNALTETMPMSGDFQLTYRHIIQNTGNTILENIRLTDILDPDVFCMGLLSVDNVTILGSSTATTAPTANSAGYDGTATDPNIFTNAASLLMIGETVVVDVQITVDASMVGVGCPTPQINQATVIGTPTDGMGTTLTDAGGTDLPDVTDLSDFGTDPQSNNGDNNNNTPTPVHLPAELALTKAITATAPAASGVAGNFDVTIFYTIQNTGGQNVRDIDLNDDLDTQWGSAFVGVVTAPVVVDDNQPAAFPAPTANGAYDGDTDTNLLNGDGVLGLNAGGRYMQVQVVVEVDASEAPPTGLMNQAEVSGTDGGVGGGPVSDLSDDRTSVPTQTTAGGSNPGAAGDDGTGDTNNPTPLYLPSISATKAVVGTPVAAASGTAGRFDVTFEIEVENTGSTTLENLQVAEDLDDQLADAFVDITTGAVITASTADTDPVASMTFDGNGDVNIFNGTSGQLNPGQSYTFTIVVEVEAGEFLDGVNDENQVTASGLPTDGNGTALPDPNMTDGSTIIPVSDDSDDGTGLADNGDPNDPNDGAQGGNVGNTNDPTPIVIPAEITLTKSLDGIPTVAASGAVGNYDATYTFEVCNIGGETLTNISLTDDFVTQFTAAGFVQVVSGPTQGAQSGNDAGLNYPSVVASGMYTGVGVGAEMFVANAGVGLQAGACTEVTIVIEVDADQLPALVENSATTEGDTPGGMTITDDSDDTTDLDNDMNSDTPGLDDDTPTPFPPLPEISVAKAYTNASTQLDGDVRLEFEFEIENTGNTQLRDIDLTDALTNFIPAANPTSQDITVSVTNIDASTAPTANAGYDATTDSNLLDGASGVLDPNQRFTVSLALDVDPVAYAALTMPVTNQATAVGTPTFANGANIPDPTDPANTLDDVDDLSDSGTVAEGNNPMDDVVPGDDPTDPDNPTPVVLPPAIQVEKATVSVGPAASGELGNVDYTYSFMVRNIGGVILDGVDLSDNFSGQFGSGFVGVVTAPAVSVPVTDAASTDPSPVATFNGTMPNDILVNTGTLAVNDEFTVTVTVELDLDMLPSDATNQATASGDDPNDVNVEDESDDQTDLNNDMTNDNPDDPADPTNDPTPVIPVPSIHLAKAVNMANAQGGDVDTQIVTYRHIVKNTGNTILENIMLTDDMATALQGGYVSTENIVVMNTTGMGATTTLPIAAAANTNMDGMNSAITGGLVGPGQSFIADITVKVSLVDIMPDQPLLNQSTVTGTATDGMGNTLEDAAGVALPAVTDDSDSGMTPDDTNDGAPNSTPGGSDDPTPLSLPGRIGVVKGITGYTDAASGEQNHYDVTIQYSIENTGSNNLMNINLIDMIESQWGDAFVGVTTPPSVITAGTDAMTTDPTANAGFNGDADSNMLSADGTLSPDEFIVVEVVLEVDAVESPATGLENQATASGTDPLNNDISDLSDDNTATTTVADPDTDNPNGAGDDGTGDMNNPTPLNIPSIGLAKTVTAVEEAGTPGNFNVTYRLVLENNGTTPLENIALEDDAAAQLAPGFVAIVEDAEVVSSSATTLPDTTGISLGMILDGMSGVLLPAEQIIVEYTVEIDASLVPTAGDENQATTEGTPTDGMGVTLLDPNNPDVEFEPVTDDSDSGIDPNGNNPDAPGDMGTPDDPTPLPPLPAISLAKTITDVSDAASGIVGNVDVTYVFEIMNTGNTDLEDISLIDDIKAQYDNAFVSVTDTVSVTAGEFNNSFVGALPSAELLNEEADLAQGERMTVTVILEIDPDATGAIYNVEGDLENQGLVSATPIDSNGDPIMDPNDPTMELEEVSDLSDNGTDPESDNQGQPGDTDPMDDPTFDDKTLLNVPSVVVAKTVFDVLPAKSGVEGNFDVILRYNVQNDGNEDLSNLSLTDDIMGQYGAAFVGVVTPPNFASVSTASAGPSLNMMYAGTGDLLIPAATDLMTPNQGYIIDVVVEVDADMVSDTLFNQATTTGQPVDPTGMAVGMPVTDDSDSGVDPETDNPLDDDDRGTDMDPTSLVLPNISVSKRQLGFVETVTGPYGNVDLTFEFVVQNTGNTPLTDIQLSDDLASELGGIGLGFVQLLSVEITDSTTMDAPSLNPAFNGLTPGNIFLGNDGVLNTGETVTVQATVEFNPIAPNLAAPLRNSATASGNDPGDNQVTDSSDDGTDPASNNPNDPGQGGGPNEFDDPTPVEVPRVYVTKEFTGFERAASNVVGNYDLTFVLKIQNTGNVDLDSIQIVDDMVDQFGSSFVSVLSTAITNSDADMNPTLSMTYLGGMSDGNIFDDNTGSFSTLQTIEVTVVVEVNPDAASPSDLEENQATGTAKDMRGTEVTDDSDDGLDPLTENPTGDGDDPNDPRSVDDPTPVIIPSINTSKTIISVAEAASDVEGNVDVVFELSVENTGNIELEDISLIDDMQAQLGSAFVAVIDTAEITESTADTDPVINEGYEGTAANADFFDGESGLLAVDDSVTIRITVELDPNAAGAITPLTNQAMAMGVDSLGNEPTDLSDSGLNSEDNNIGQPGDTGGQDDPTLLELPSISVSKSVKDFTRLAASNTVGNFDVTYLFEVKNTGNVTLTDINLLDDLNAQFGAGFVRKVPDLELGDDNPKVINVTAATPPGGNNGYDGGIVDDNLLDGMGSFDQDQVFTVELVVEVNPNNFAAPDTLFNSAAVDGTFTAIDGDVFNVLDVSDAGPVSESNNPGEPGGGPESDNPTPLILSDINISKQILTVVDAASDIEGNIDVTYEFLIKNKGNDTLRNIQLVDDLMDQYGDAFVGTVTPAAIDLAITTATQAPTLSGLYDGGDEGVFTGTDGVFAPNEFIRVTYTAEIDPDMSADVNMDMIPDTLYNTATTEGVNPAGETVDDESDHGNDPESNNTGFEGDTGGMDDPTPLAAPVISVTKEVIEYKGSATPGVLDVVYSLVIQNTGNVQLENISLLDTMDAADHLGAGHLGIAAGEEPTIVASTADVNPNLNGAFDGTAANANIFDGMSGLLQAGQRIVIEFTGTLNATLSADPSMLFNQALATGENDGLTVVDFSDSGNDPTTNNPDGETNDGNGPDGPDDPTPVFPCISNGIAACKGDVNLSLDPVTCMTVVVPSMVGADIPEFCNFYYTVVLRDENGDIIPDNKLDGSYIGQMIEYTIIEPEQNNSCWGVLTLEYKFPPMIQCAANDTLSCTQAFSESTLTPDVSVSCSPATLQLVFESAPIMLDCDPQFSAMLTRKWVAEDEFGNVSDTCTSMIFLERTNLDEIVPVTPAAIFIDAAISCSSGFATTSQGYPFPALSVTGAPKLRLEDGSLGDIFPFTAGSICNGFAEFEDEILQGSTSCVTKILRTFTIGEWFCGSTNERTFTQLIEVVDFTGPALTCPADMTVSTGSFECAAMVSVPLPVASDLCNDELTINLGGMESGLIENYNGQSFELGVGTHELQYAVYDACEQGSFCTFTVTVVDNADPIAICDQFTEVSISLETTTFLPAEAIDDGSFDECGPVTLSVARMDDPGFADFTGFGPQVDIICTDAGQTIMVGLLVTDMGGNTNMCMVAVDVKDKVEAQMVCPNDTIVECNFAFDPNNLDAFFGAVQIFDNCPAANTIDQNIVGELNTCGTGVLTRQIRLLNPQGVQTDYCEQSITFQSGDPLSFDDITPPQSEITITGCGISALDNLNAQVPIIPDGVCQQVAMSVESDTFPFNEDGSCFKIIRTFRIIDWCISDGPGSIFSPFTFEQVIKVNDDEKPIFTQVFEDSTYCSFDVDCGGRFIDNLTASATDACTDDAILVRNYEVRSASGAIVRSGLGHDASGTYDLGDFTVRFIVEDKCGNQQVAESSFSVMSCKQPVAYCLDGLSATLTAMDTDNDGIADAELLMITPSFFDAGSYHPCGLDVTLSFSADVDDTLRVFSCADTVGILEIPLWVTALDSDGNPLLDMSSVCEASFDVQDNEAIDLCNGIPNLVDIQGRIYTAADAELYEAEVKLLFAETLVQMTDENGEYGFMDMPEGGNYKVAPHKDDDVLNGVSTLDLVMIQRHLLGIQEFDNVYDYIAADINHDDKITASDLLALRKVILGISMKFQNNTSWRFIDEGHTFEDQTDPWYSTFPESYDISGLTENMWIDFLGVKIGDINGNVASNVLSGAFTETRSADVLTMSIPNTEVVSDKVYEIEIATEEAINLKGLQMALDIDGAEVLEIIPGAMNIKTNDILSTENEFKISYANAVGDYVQSQGVLYTIVLRAERDGLLSDMISLNDKSIDAESYLGDDLATSAIEIEWRDDESVSPVELLVVGTASPNPWRSQADINFEIPTAGDVTLIIRDASGRVLYSKEDKFDAGRQAFTITDEDVNITGILLYEIKYGEQVVHKKMIRIE